MMATIGRNAAVAHIGGLAFTGFVAWVGWLGVHLIKLIGFRNRLFVLMNWAWDTSCSSAWYALFCRPRPAARFNGEGLAQAAFGRDSKAIRQIPVDCLSREASNSD